VSTFVFEFRKKIEEGLTIQWSNEIKQKGQTIIYKALHKKLKIGDDLGELMCSGRVGSSCSTCGIRHVGN